MRAAEAETAAGPCLLSRRARARHCARRRGGPRGCRNTSPDNELASPPIRGAAKEPGATPAERTKRAAATETAGEVETAQVAARHLPRQRAGAASAERPIHAAETAAALVPVPRAARS